MNKQFYYIDLVIRPQLEAALQKNKEVKHEIEVTKIRYHNEKGQFITTRRMLAIAYNSVAAEESVISTDHILKLVQLPWYGDSDDQVRRYYYAATELLSKVERYVSEETKRNAIYYTLRITTTLFKDRIIRDYDPKPEAERTADLLMSLVKSYLDERKSIRVYERDYMPNLSPSKSGQTAKNRRQDDANAAAAVTEKKPKGGKGNPKGFGKDKGKSKDKGKGKGDPKGGKNKNKGKSKGGKGKDENGKAFTGPRNQDPSRYNPKRLCRAFQKCFGQEGCPKGDKCKYLHLVAKTLDHFNMIPTGRAPKSEDGYSSTQSDSAKPNGGKAAAVKAKAEAKKKEKEKRSPPPSDSEP